MVIERSLRHPIDPFRPHSAKSEMTSLVPALWLARLSANPVCTISEQGRPTTSGILQHTNIIKSVLLGGEIWIDERLLQLRGALISL